MRYQNVDVKIPQTSVSIISPYNIQTCNCDPSYKCGLSFFEVFIKLEQSDVIADKLSRKTRSEKHQIVQYLVKKPCILHVGVIM